MPDIQLLQRDPQTGLISLGLGNSPKKLTGLELLAQIVTLEFLRNPGRDVIDPDEGSGIRQDIGQFNFGSEDEIKLLVMQRSKRVEQRIVSQQTVGTGDPTEKLKKLVVVDIAAEPQNSRVMARVRVVNQAGDETDILV